MRIALRHYCEELPHARFEDNWKIYLALYDYFFVHCEHHLGHCAACTRRDHFDIKKNIAQPLLQGLHSSFVGLNDSTIDWTIPVKDVIYVDRATAQLDTTIPINVAETVVTLTQPVPLTVGANIVAPA